MHAPRAVRTAEVLILLLVPAVVAACDLGPQRPATDPTPVAPTPISVELAATGTVPTEPDAAAPPKVVEGEGPDVEGLPEDNPFPLWYPAPTPDATAAAFSERVRDAVLRRSVADLEALLGPYQQELHVVHLPSRGTDRISATLGISMLARVDVPDSVQAIAFEPLPDHLADLPDALRRVAMDIHVFPGRGVADVLFSRGWGEDGRGEAALIVLEAGDDTETAPPFLAGWIWAPEGFRAAASATPATHRPVTWTGLDGTTYGLDIPAGWHLDVSETGDPMQLHSRQVAGTDAFDDDLLRAPRAIFYSAFYTGATHYEQAVEALTMTPPPGWVESSPLHRGVEPGPTASTLLRERWQLTSGEDAIVLGAWTETGEGGAELAVDMGPWGTANLMCGGGRSQQLCRELLRSLRVERRTNRPAPTPDPRYERLEELYATEEADAAPTPP